MICYEMQTDGAVIYTETRLVVVSRIISLELRDYKEKERHSTLRIHVEGYRDDPVIVMGERKRIEGYYKDLKKLLGDMVDRRYSDATL